MKNKNRKTFVYIIHARSMTARVFRVMRVKRNAHRHVLLGLVDLNKINASQDDVIKYLVIKNHIRSSDVASRDFNIEAI